MRKHVQRSLLKSKFTGLEPIQEQRVTKKRSIGQNQASNADHSFEFDSEEDLDAR